MDADKVQVLALALHTAKVRADECAARSHDANSAYRNAAQASNEATDAYRKAREELLVEVTGDRALFEFMYPSADIVVTGRMKLDG